MSDDEHKEDLDFEPEDEFGTAGATQAKIKKLREQLKEAQAKRDEYLAGWQRCKADSINEKRDALQQASRQGERVKDAFVEDILPSLDSFDMAVAHESWEAVSEGWKSGMGRVQNQLLDALQKNGVQRFGKAGEFFDPRRHEAIQEVEDGDAESHTVLKVLRHGYVAGERVIRPAQVIVRK
ncbi:nucleotide exchange factor GrpE [Candidatus Kaiserbacteria bacterium]|nr:nucleotide exchange factor GrpE [Candidatus Kaiserbacteria bacterium]